MAFQPYLAIDLASFDVGLKPGMYLAREVVFDLLGARRYVFLFLTKTKTERFRQQQENLTITTWRRVLFHSMNLLRAGGDETAPTLTRSSLKSF